ncbi:Bro-N domain-containing protein [Tateyamaria sp.]|uniref:BRO-N domain-containing protein n=1 Tax=Tateyamaria sp. TaxID=1929288 RepID=UPI00329AA963
MNPRHPRHPRKLQVTLSWKCFVNFQFNSHNIRVIEIKGEPWFVAKDVCLCLHGRTSGISSMSSKFGKDEKQTVYKVSASVALSSLFEGNQYRLALLSESGIYKLIMRSDKPEAREFTDWVTKVVLPAIRKDGGYIMGEEKVATGEMDEDEFVLKVVGVMKRNVDRHREDNIKLTLTIS